MADNFKLNWYGEEVALQLEDASDEGLLALAYQLEGEIKVGAPVDTGFMRNTTYVHSPKASTFQAQNKTVDGKDYATTDAPPPAEKGTTFVGVGADYTIYVETKQPFIYPALLRIAKTAGAIVASKIREKIA